MRDMHPAVRAAFDAAPLAAREGMLVLRAMILDQAVRLPRIGRIEEALRWRQPAYLTPETGAACSLRIGTLRDGGFGLFVHCRTTLIEEFRSGPGAGMRTEGTRAVLFRAVEDIVAEPVGMLIVGALTWHLPDPGASGLDGRRRLAEDRASAQRSGEAP
jgi:hypothetical protein